MADSHSTYVCKDCGAEFELTASEKTWYAQQGFELPRRCKTCRDKRKKGKRDKSRMPSKN